MSYSKKEAIHSFFPPKRCTSWSVGDTYQRATFLVKQMLKDEDDVAEYLAKSGQLLVTIWNVEVSFTLGILQLQFNSLHLSINMKEHMVAQIRSLSDVDKISITIITRQIREINPASRQKGTQSRS